MHRVLLRVSWNKTISGRAGLQPCLADISSRSCHEIQDKVKEDKIMRDKEDSKKDSEDGKKGDENDKIIVKVEGGDVSRAVSKKVFDAGLVDDVEEFNAYLGAHGYDNLLQPGTYHIKKGASFEQIAKILTSK